MPRSETLNRTTTAAPASSGRMPPPVDSVGARAGATAVGSAHRNNRWEMQTIYTEHLENRRATATGLVREAGRHTQLLVSAFRSSESPPPLGQHSLPSPRQLPSILVHARASQTHKLLQVLPRHRLTATTHPRAAPVRRQQTGKRGIKKTALGVHSATRASATNIISLDH